MWYFFMKAGDSSLVLWGVVWSGKAYALMKSLWKAKYGTDIEN